MSESHHPSGHPATTHVLYLHGFRSSPQSSKAQQMQNHVRLHQPQVHLWCPALPASPQQALELMLQGTVQWPTTTTAVIGSSLGGYYASAFAQQRHCPSVLINPATHPARDLARYIGEITLWHSPQERLFFLPHYMDELRAMDASHLPPTGRELLIAAQGDEVLDWREMVARYPHAQQHLVAGSNHALTDFEDHLPLIDHYLGWHTRAHHRLIHTN